MPHTVHSSKTQREGLENSLEEIPEAEFSNLLFNYLSHAPLSLALREINRFAVLKHEAQHIQLNTDSKVLDVGCGDGFWWSLLQNNRPKIYGIDIAKIDLSQAGSLISATKDTDISSKNAVADIQNAAWPSAFDLVIGNCSLEHVPRLDASLENISKLTRIGGYFLLFVPTQGWAMQGLGMSFLSKHFPRLAMMFSGALNGFFKHWHLLTDRTWVSVLEAQGFEVEKITYMGSKTSEFLFRLFLPTSFVSYLFKVLTGQYLNRFSPKFLRRWTVKIVLKFLKAKHASISLREQRTFAYEYAFLCRRLP